MRLSRTDFRSACKSFLKIEFARQDITAFGGLELMRRRRPHARRDTDLTNGPGKLCLALGIDGRLNWNPLQKPPLLIRAGEPIVDRDVAVTPRIGITRAADWPLRWYVRDNPYVSGKRRTARGEGAGRRR